MTVYSAETLDLSRLPASPLVLVDYAKTTAERLKLLAQLWEEHRQRNPSLPALDTLMLESEPAVVLNEEFSFAETAILQEINDAAKALRLAQSFGDALEHLTTTYHRTHRQVIAPATDRTPALLESDDELRLRAQLQPEQLAEFGLTPGSYIYRVRTAFADRIKDVRPIRRGGGSIELRVLGRGSGAVPPATIAEIIRAFHPEGASQSTDILSVVAAETVTIPVSVRLVLRRGPDPEAVKAAARRSLLRYADDVHKLGATVYREAVGAAAHVGSVETVIVETPGADLPGRPEAAPLLTITSVESEVA